MKSNQSGDTLLPEVVGERPSERASGCLLGIGAVGLMFLGVLEWSRFLVGMGAMMAGSLVLWRLARDYRSGTTSSNWGTWRHDENPVGFRRNIGFWAVVTILWFVLGVLVMLGAVPIPFPKLQ